MRMIFFGKILVSLYGAGPGPFSPAEMRNTWGIRSQYPPHRAEARRICGTRLYFPNMRAIADIRDALLRDLR